MAHPDPDRPAREDLVEVARYPRRSVATERSLVVLALGLGCWIFEEGHEHVLCVRPADAAVVRAELLKFERELAAAPAPVEPPVAAAKIPMAPLWATGWMLALCFLVQQVMPPWLEARGIASSERMVGQGEWWRAVTALTLHQDFFHFAANLITGLLFTAFLLPLLGSGVTWSGILVAGSLGNLINAWGHRGVTHHSLGASTAVFGALGMLSAFQCTRLFVRGCNPRLWEVVLPLGAGLALLAYLGVGDADQPLANQTDFMAHLWGFVSGLVLGALGAVVDPQRRLGAGVQRGLAWLALGALVGAWLAAAAA